MSESDTESPETLWEYKAVSQSEARDIEALFNELGREGWEYVALGSAGLKGHHIFKRPIKREP